MTKEEAIEELKADIAMYDNEISRLEMFKEVGDGRLIQALEMGIEAIRKQIPMKPITHKIYGWISNTYGCPVCRESLDVGFGCRKCLQAIDWKEGEKDDQEDVTQLDREKFWEGK